MILKWSHSKKFNFDTCSVYEEVFNSEINLVLCSQDKFKNFLKTKFGSEIELENFYALTYQIDLPDKHYIFVNIQKLENNAECFSTLVHELTHAVDYILNAKGLIHCDESSETYSYMIEFYFKNFYNLYMEKLKPKRKKKSNKVEVKEVKNE